MASLDDKTRDEVPHIQHALARLDGGLYGICDNCKKPIPAKRLKALPYVTRCLRCEAATSGIAMAR